MLGAFTIKICGLSTPEAMQAALDAGADMVGLVFHPKSPRFVADDVARDLACQARGRAQVVALVVDFDDARMDAIAEAARPDWWQLHGREDQARIAAIRARHGLPVMKAIGWSDGAGPQREVVTALGRVADRLLLDATPPKDAAYPGGHGQPFDWATLCNLPPGTRFMLAGGLYPHNVSDAIRTVRGLGCALKGVDVSSGVESAPGVKDARKIRDFIAAARAAAAETSVKADP